MLTGLSSGKQKEIFWLTAIMLFFGIIYSLISLVNHYQFRTYALDLGMMNNALYCFSHFKANYLLLNPFGGSVNFLGDHFSPIMFLYVPLYYLFGSYTLLLIQIASILIGGMGIYKYAKLKFPEGYIPLIILFQFFGIWSIYSALSFDFHNNVIAAMFVPWFIYFHEKKHLKISFLLFILILASRENMALWMIFILLGLIMKGGIKNYRTYLKFELPLLLGACAYFILVNGHIMPWLQNLQNNHQLYRYSSLGNSGTEIATNIITHPGHILSLLFNSQYPEEKYFGIKSELHIMVFVSGGIAILCRPFYLLMLIPVYLQKFLSDDCSVWGINGQYSIEFAPILSLALIDLAEKIPSTKYKYFLCILFATSTHFSNIFTMDHRRSPGYDSWNTRYYSPAHYDSELNLKEIYSGIKLIPDNVSLSVSSSLAPHLANRYKIYSFPIIKDAEYIALITDHSTTYPLSRAVFIKTIDSLKASNNFLPLYDKDNLLILKKK